MKITYLPSSLLLLVFAVVCGAQAVKPPNDIVGFNGRWVSETVKISSDSGRRDKDTDPNLKIEMIVSQSGNELKVKETTLGNERFSRDSVYYIDGRGESNKGFTDNFVYESKTSQKDRKLLIEGTIRSQGAGGKSIKTKEDWEISADGKTLTIKTKTSGMGTIRYEKVFRLAL